MWRGEARRGRARPARAARGGAGGRRVLGRLRGRAGTAARPALGVLMVAAGVMIALGWDTRLTTELVRDVPAYTDTLQALTAVKRLVSQRGPAAP